MIFADMPPSHYEWQVPYQTAEMPHLILHFDMNKTMIATDKVGQKSAHDTICAVLADRIVSTWDETTPPMDYFHYVKYHLLPNSDNSREIKLKQKEKVAQLLDFLKASNHPAYGEAQETYDRAMNVLEKQETEIFTSFHKLIKYLHEKKISYTLVIRTFGSEATEIAHELNERFGAGFIEDFRMVKQGD